MKRFCLALSPAEIAAVCGGEYRGADGLALSSVADPAAADATSVIFWEQDKYFVSAKDSAAALIFCLPENAEKLPGRNLLLHPKHYFGLMKLVSWWLERCAEKPAPGVHPSAVIDPSAELGAGVHIGAFAWIGKGCRLADGVIVSSHCCLDENVSLGAGTLLYPRVTLYSDTVIGTNCILHSGAVIGADGFGFLLHEGRQQKIPQVGNVVLGDYVEIGANTAIDRGTLGPTVVGEGTKIDNSVQIGHNCVIGCHSILCAQVGLAGSTKVGDYVYLAGQVGVAGHVSIGDRAMVGAQSGVSSDVPADSRYLGYPAMDAGEFKRMFASQKHLPQIYRAFLRQQKAEKE